MRKVIRKYLRLDTWGMDIFRIKRKLGELVQWQDEQTLWTEDFAYTLEDISVLLSEQAEQIERLKDRVAVLEGEQIFEEKSNSPEKFNGSI